MVRLKIAGGMLTAARMAPPARAPDLRTSRGDRAGTRGAGGLASPFAIQALTAAAGVGAETRRFTEDGIPSPKRCLYSSL